MAVQAVPYVETALSHSAELFRRELQAELPPGSAGGVVPATPGTAGNLTAGTAGCTDLKVSAPGSGMTVNVSAGAAYVCGTLGSGSGYGMGTGYAFPTVTLNGGSLMTVAATAIATTQQLTTQGTYYVYNDNSAGAVSLAIATANASNPRIDVVIAQVEDAAYSGANNDWKLAVVTGTAAASPTVPALPASSLVLAYVWIPAASSSVTAGNILDLRVAYDRNPFRAQMTRAAAYTQAAAGMVQFPFDTVVSDVSGSCTTGTSAAFTCPVAGVYLVAGATEFTPVSTDRYLLTVRKTATEMLRLQDLIANGTTATAVMGMAAIICNQGDVLNLAFDSVTATNVVFAVSSAVTYMTVTLVATL
jgi:hypothetical protein